MLPITQDQSLSLPAICVGSHWYNLYRVKNFQKNTSTIVWPTINTASPAFLIQNYHHHPNELDSIWIVFAMVQLLLSSMSHWFYIPISGHILDPCCKLLYPWTQVQFSLQMCKNKTCQITKLCVCVCQSHSVSPLQLVNQWMTSVNPWSLVSPNGEHHTFRVHMISTNNKADTLNLWRGNQH
jgi:hypothetical protein